MEDKPAKGAERNNKGQSEREKQYLGTVIQKTGLPLISD